MLTRFSIITAAILALTINLNASTEAATTTFNVAVPASTPAGDTVYIAGDFQGWNPGHPGSVVTSDEGISAREPRDPGHGVGSGRDGIVRGVSAHARIRRGDGR